MIGWRGLAAAAAPVGWWAWERLKKRPSYAQAILGFPHPLIEHGMRRLKAVKAADPSLREALEGARS